MKMNWRVDSVIKSRNRTLISRNKISMIHFFHLSISTYNLMYDFSHKTVPVPDSTNSTDF